MSEKLYARLLRLFPSSFREIYGDEALQLFRDRSSDERGFFPRLRLWLDLLLDLAVSVPREYRHVQPNLVRGAEHRLDGVPSFYVLQSETPGFGSLLSGGVLALVALAVFSVSLKHYGNYLGRAEISPDQMLDHPRASQQQTPHLTPPDISNALDGAADDTAKLDADERRHVIDVASANLKVHYVDPNLARRMSNALLKLMEEPTGSAP